MAQGILPFKYEEEKKATGMTALAGLPLYLELAQKTGLGKSIQQHIKVRESGQGWTDSQIVMALILLNLAGGDWEMRCPVCGSALDPEPTAETKPLHPTSVYAVTKRDQEELCLSVGGAYGIPTVALRYFNVYGPRQSLDNPYTGVAAIFTCRLLNDRPPVVFEDGVQSRDFVHVSDIIRANVRALEPGRGDGEAINIATGRSLGLQELTAALRARLGGPEPEYVGRFRKGDIRHCFGDPTKARELLDFETSIRFEDGIDDLAAWADGQEAVDRIDEARRELEAAGLTV
jgi:dTDP-L-rhamnose 4-epimerase